MTFLPILKKQRKPYDAKMHSDDKPLSNLAVPAVGRIAVALDFSVNDEKLIAQALQQGARNASYVLLHVVESATAKYSGETSDDYETRRDKERLESYAIQLRNMGYDVEYYIGYKSRAKEIIRIVRSTRSEMLVMGAHRHAGLKDYIFGQTIEAVRHELEIPVLIINI
jgi:manganese transport protein